MNRFIVPSILALGALLYFYHLPETPPGFFCDEASEGYDAYCLSRTLRDQHGALLPFFLKAFGDWRGAAYAYLCVPAVKCFGLNEAAVRGVAAVVGILTILFTYLLAREIAGEGAGLCSALFLAISPWQFFFSRVAFGHITFPLFFVIAFYFFLRGIRGGKRNTNLFLSGMFFSLTIYTYFSARLLVPLFVAVLILIYGKELWAMRKSALLFLVALCIFSIPFADLLLFHRADATARFTALSGDAWPRASRVLPAYLDSYSYRFLFKEGDGWPRSVVRGYGVLHVYYLPFIIIGLAMLIRRRSAADKALVAWLALYPLPSALVGGAAVVRNIIASPLYAILTGYGAYSLFSYLHRKPLSGGTVIPWLKRCALYILVLVYIPLAFHLSIGYFRHYFLEYPLYSWGDYSGWFFGVEEAFDYVRTVRGSYDEVIWNLYGTFPNRPEILVNFYMPGDSQCRIGNLNSYTASRKQLFIVSPARLRNLNPGVYRVLKRIAAPDGAPAWAIIELTEYPFEKREMGKILVDDEDPGFTVISGSWATASEDGCYGDINHGSHRSQGVGEARWTLTVPHDGEYEVFARWSECHSRATDTPYTIHHRNGLTTARVNQQKNGGRWNSLGAYSFSRDTPAVITITNDANLWVIADAIKLEPRR